MHLWHFSFSHNPSGQAQHGRTALAIGNFDGVHLGHRALIAQLRKKAASLGVRTAALTFDPHPREYLFPQSAPLRISSLRDKLALLQETGIDEVFVAKFDHGLANLAAKDFAQNILTERIRPGHILVGEDFFFGRQRQGNIHLLVQHGLHAGWEVGVMETRTLDNERISSTHIREALRAGNLGLAGQLLGRPYDVLARVLPSETATNKPGIDLRLEQPSIALGGCHSVDLVDHFGQRLAGHARLSPRQISMTAGRPTIRITLKETSPWTAGARIRVVFQESRRKAQLAL